MRIRNLVTLALLIVLVLVPTYAQQAVRTKISLSDSYGQKIEYGNIEILNDRGTVSYRVIDSYNPFFDDYLAYGEYIVAAQAYGYQDLNRTITISADTPDIIVMLTPITAVKHTLEVSVVYALNDSPIHNSTVRIMTQPQHNPDGITKTTPLANATGPQTLYELYEGEYSVASSAPGFYIEVENISLYADANVTLRLAKAPLGSIEISVIDKEVRTDRYQISLTPISFDDSVLTGRLPEYPLTPLDDGERMWFVAGTYEVNVHDERGAVLYKELITLQPDESKSISFNTESFETPYLQMSTWLSMYNQRSQWIVILFILIMIPLQALLLHLTVLTLKLQGPSFWKSLLVSSASGFLSMIGSLIPPNTRGPFNSFAELFDIYMVIGLIMAAVFIAINIVIIKRTYVLRLSKSVLVWVVWKAYYVGLLLLVTLSSILFRLF